MAGTIQLVGYVKIRLVPLARIQIIVDYLYVTRSLFREYVEQHRVHFQPVHGAAHFLCGWCRNRQYSRVGITVGKCIRACNHQVDIGSRFSANLQLLNQFRHHRCRFDSEFNHRRRTHERSVNQPIQQILDAPAILANAFSADHPSTSLERMEGPAHRNQRLHVIR